MENYFLKLERFRYLHLVHFYIQDIKPKVYIRKKASKNIFYLKSGCKGTFPKFILALNSEICQEKNGGRIGVETRLPEEFHNVFLF